MLLIFNKQKFFAESKKVRNGTIFPKSFYRAESRCKCLQDTEMLHPLYMIYCHLGYQFVPAHFSTAVSTVYYALKLSVQKVYPVL